MTIKIYDVNTPYEEEFSYLLTEIEQLKTDVLVLATLKSTLKRAKMLELTPFELLSKYNPKAPKRAFTYSTLPHEELITAYGDTKYRYLEKHIDVAIARFYRDYDKTYPYTWSNKR